MPVFSGNTSSSATSTAYDNPVLIKSFSVTNKTASGVTVSVSILYGSTNTMITPLNITVAPNEIFEDSKGILVLPGRQIYVLVSGDCDYYFTLIDFK